MRIRPATTEDVEACVEVLASLPDYFTESTHEEVRRDLVGHNGLVADSGTSVVGFILARRGYQASAEITHAAVHTDSRGQGIGTALVDQVIGMLAEAEVALIEVKTLDASAGYEPYEATRAFWEGRGFVQVDCIDPLPGWDPGNPSAIYVKALRVT